LLPWAGTTERPGRATYIKLRKLACFEVGVQVAQRWILARLRNRRFFSLAELIPTIRELVVQLIDQFARIDGPKRRFPVRADLPGGLQRAFLLGVTTHSGRVGRWPFGDRGAARHRGSVGAVAASELSPEEGVVAAGILEAQRRAARATQCGGPKTLRIPLAMAIVLWHSQTGYFFK
jgi:hypothetical protein